ncbi:MAG TPA: hypothetical protein PLO25_01835 [Candidatus Saccharibacteria bacterium]|nr:hypothetical protein [Candidatus Saccharibacteria bacterium]
MVWIFAVVAVVLFFIKSLPNTWSAFVALSAILAYIATKVIVDFPWNLIVLAIWFITLVYVFFARFRTKEANIAMIVMLIVMSFVVGFASTQEQEDKQTETKSIKIEDRARNALSSNGWQDGDYTFDIDLSKVAGEAGNNPFSSEGAKTPEQIVRFLESDTDASNALLGSIISRTDATKTQVLDKENWIAVQSKKDFGYDGNTMFSDGKVEEVGSKKGLDGEIFLLFLPPNGKSKMVVDETASAIESTTEIFSVRGACLNPQGSVPKPTPPVLKPTPKPEEPPIIIIPDTPVLLPKDASKDVLANPDVADWKKNDGDLMEVSDRDGSRVANGYQEDPEEDADIAEERAEDKNEASEKRHEIAIEDAEDDGAGTSSNDGFDRTARDEDEPDW